MKFFARHRLRFYRRVCAPVVLLSGELSYSLGGEDDFPWDIHPASQNFDVYRARFRDGHFTLIGCAGGEVVFTAWIARRHLRVDECAWTWRIAEPDAVVYDCVTAETWRGRGIYPEALRRLAGMLAEKGIRHLWIYSEEDNRPSLAGITKAQFEFRGSINSRTMFGITWRNGSVKGVNA